MRPIVHTWAHALTYARALESIMVRYLLPLARAARAVRCGAHNKPEKRRHKSCHTSDAHQRTITGGTTHRDTCTGHLDRIQWCV
jgi:hypothetical protein